MKTIIYDESGYHHPRWLSNLKAYLKNKGHMVHVIVGTHSDDVWYDMVKDCAHLFMWNGAEPQHQPIKAVCDKTNVNWSIVEVGWFPQNKNWFVDNKGVNADAALMEDDLSWVTDADYAKLEKLREEYLQGRKWEQGDYVLVPLQLESDTNIVLHSPFKKMQGFVNYCERKFKRQNIIFKRHPLDRAEYYTKHKLLTSGNFVDYALKSKEVYGLNSTTLLEAKLCKVPVTQLGDGYLKAHAGHPELLLAALAGKQICVEQEDLSRWIDN